MSASSETVEELVHKAYPHGFVTEIDADTVPPGLSEDVVRLISAKKGEPEWLLEWRLKAYRHWLTLREPTWAHVHHGPIDYDAISYYSAPKSRADGPKSLEDVDPRLLPSDRTAGTALYAFYCHDEDVGTLRAIAGESIRARPADIAATRQAAFRSALALVDVDTAPPIIFK